MLGIRLTITISPQPGRFVEELVAETGENESAVVSHALEELRRKRLEALLREGYLEMAALDPKLAEDFDRLDRTSPWPEYA